MYLLKDGYTYYKGTEQHRSRGAFLILLSRDNEPGLRAIVRKVALSQFGHFMMGTARVYGRSLTISGSYGSDGLPIHLDNLESHWEVCLNTGRWVHLCDNPEWVDRVWNSAIPLPQKLYDAWNHGGGWNSAGSEATAMRQWAIKQFGL